MFDYSKYLLRDEDDLHYEDPCDIVERQVSDGLFFYHDINEVIEGADSITELISYLSEFAKSLDTMADEGYMLERPVEDGQIGIIFGDLLAAQNQYDEEGETETFLQSEAAKIDPPEEGVTANEALADYITALETMVDAQHTLVHLFADTIVELTEEIELGRADEPVDGLDLDDLFGY